MTPSKTIHTRVPLTEADLAELDRRRSNAAASRRIWWLKEERKAITFCISLLHQAQKERAIDSSVDSINFLKAIRDTRLAEIQILEATKRKAPRGDGGA